MRPRPMPACPELAVAADAAVGPDDCFEGASDAELAGVLSAWDRLEAHMAARKLAAVAELIRGRPEPGCDPGGRRGFPRRGRNSPAMSWPIPWPSPAPAPTAP
jgi:hypothetical protein